MNLTHATALAAARPGHGLKATTCPGRLLLLESHPDHHLTRSGRTLVRSVSVYECFACGHRIVLAREEHADFSDLDHEALNDYVPVPYDLVRELAARLQAPPLPREV